jgi:hypothetical protein
MYDSPSSSNPLAQPDNDASTIQSEMFRRTFHCGHPDEFIEVTRDDDGEHIHNLVTFATCEAVNRPFGSLPVYTQARCLKCAKHGKEQDDRNPKIRSKKTLGTYKAVSTSTGLEGVLVRYRYSADQGSVQPHPRVSEADHHAHRIDMLGKAVECAGNWLPVPARRIQDMPVQIEAAARPAPHQLELAPFNGGEDADHLNKPDYCDPQSVLEVAKTVEGLSEILEGKSAEGTDESYRMAAANCISSSASRRERQKRRSAATTIQSQPELTATNDQEVHFGGLTEARCSQGASGVVSSNTSYEALLECHHGSPLDAFTELILTSQRYEQPRLALAVLSDLILLRKGALNFIRRRSSTSTRGHSGSGSITMNFRKLGIDIQPTRSFEKTDLNSDSPDWACQTSRAIEAGRISMDSVSKQGRELIRLKHNPQAICSPTDRRNTYPSPSGNRGPVSPRHARHSESAPQALRESASRRHGRLVGMEIASPKRETSKHNSTQGALVVDLNKRLPALPPQAACEDGEDPTGFI